MRGAEELALCCVMVRPPVSSSTCARKCASRAGVVIPAAPISASPSSKAARYSARAWGATRRTTSIGRMACAPSDDRAGGARCLIGNADAVPDRRDVRLHGGHGGFERLDLARLPADRTAEKTLCLLQVRVRAGQAGFQQCNLAAMRPDRAGEIELCPLEVGDTAAPPARDLLRGGADKRERGGQTVLPREPQKQHDQDERGPGERGPQVLEALQHGVSFRRRWFETRSFAPLLTMREIG